MQQVSIAESVLDTRKSDDALDALVRAYHVLTGEPADPEALILENFHFNERLHKLELSRRWNDPASHTLEKGHTLSSLFDIFISKAPRCNVLESWPLYDYLFRKYVQPVETSAMPLGGNALLIGSEGALSSRAFAVMAKELFGVERAVITDIRGSDHKTRHGSFVYGDGLHLPFAGDCMRLAVTNQLLASLEGNLADIQNGPAAALQRLFNEAFRVLRPGGHLCMREIIVGWDDNQDESLDNQKLRKAFKHSLLKHILGAGFTRLALEQSWEFDNLNFLFDPERQFQSRLSVPVPEVVLVYAQKPTGPAAS